jgi:hypothetical protein
MWWIRVSCYCTENYFRLQAQGVSWRNKREQMESMMSPRRTAGQADTSSKMSACIFHLLDQNLDVGHANRLVRLRRLAILP